MVLLELLTTNIYTVCIQEYFLDGLSDKIKYLENAKLRDIKNEVAESELKANP